MARLDEGYVLDAGPLGALDDRDESAKRVMRIIQRAVERDVPIVIPAGALAQAYYDGRKQALLARLIARAYISHAALDAEAATQIGPLRKRTKHHDVVDVHVAWLAMTRDLCVVTTDPDDMRKLGVDDDRVLEV